MRATMQFYMHLLKTSIRETISKRSAFLIESVSIIANNLIFTIIWWIFFSQFNDIGGWKIFDMIILLAIGLGSYGLMQICFGGVKDISKLILNGDLDSFMTKPKNILLHILGSKSFAKGFGHLASAAILIFLGHIEKHANIFLIILSMCSGCLVFTAVSIIAHSIAFWLGSIETVAKKYCDALFLFALYPTNIYSGLLQIVMFTVIPAGIIGYIPIELLRNFSWQMLFIMLTSSLSFISLAFYVFYSGLKRYESGNKFGARL